MSRRRRRHFYRRSSGMTLGDVLKGATLVVGMLVLMIGLIHYMARLGG